MLPAASSCRKQDRETPAVSGVMGPHFTWKLWFTLSVERFMPSDADGTQQGFLGLHYGNLETQKPL